MRKNILWLATLLVLSLVLIQFPVFIRAGASISGPPPKRLNISAPDALTVLKKVPGAPLRIMPLAGTTFTVTTAADNLDNNNPTPGSLRAAIRNANLSAGADTIEFNIPGAAPHTINVGAGLPDITDTVTIYGYSQPGSSPNTLVDGNNAVLRVEVVGQANLFGIGLVIAANDCVVQGLAIHGFNHAILVDGHRTVAGASGNLVQGNFIGTNVTGTVVSGDFSNGAGNFSGGVWIDSGGFNPIGNPGTANNNTVGGATPASRNVISGNGAFGVQVTGTATGTFVQGNFIGTNAAGTAGIGGGDGVIINSSGNTVGGTAAGARNVISGNNYNAFTSDGVNICCNARDNLVQGNFIGTDVTGTVAVPNAVHGVVINNNAHNNTVGGTTAAARNIISGNVQAGVAIGVSSSGNKVQGNFIGTDVTGTVALGNAFYGVFVEQASSATIGGTELGAGNVISANARGGIEIASDNTIVQGNFIGTTQDGTNPLGNHQFGIKARGLNNLIGGRAIGAGNVIAYSRAGFIDAGQGVIVFGISTTATIAGNSSHSNDHLGIDLGRDGTTLNDVCDSDLNDGTHNGFQNYPVLTSANSGGGGTTIGGTLNSKPGNTYTLDFYANDVCDPLGNGEGQTYLGSTTTTTDLNCSAGFSAVVPVAVSAGQFVTATATDPLGNTSEFSACVQVVLSNSPPDAVNDAATTNEDTPVTINVLANDTDPDGDANTVTSFTQAAHGSVVNNGNGTLTYTPAVNFNGSDSFTYQISDGNGGTDTATVTVAINAVNESPDAVDDTATTREDTPVTLSVLANDANGDCVALAIAGVTGPANGSVIINLNNTITYTPNVNFSGSDTFTYSLSCAAGTDTATVTLTVTPVNDVPVAADDAVTTAEDTPVTISVLANDSDAEGDTLSVTSITAPLNGTALINADGTVTYTPNADFNGTNIFSYAVSDGNGGIDPATVTVTITPVNDAPDARDDATGTPEDIAVNINVLVHDSDADGDPLSVQSVTQPANGSVSINADGTVSYTPAANFNGGDSFTYTISDGNGGTDTATVVVTVSPVNDAPVTIGESYSADEDTSIVVNAPGVLGNDSDVEGSPLTATLMHPPSRGVLSLNANGSFTYTPSANFNGNEFFIYLASDGSSATPATVNITINSVNDAPIAANDSYTATENTPLTITAPGVLLNDRDIEGSALTAALVSAPTHGVLSLNEDGSFTYTPDAGYTGCDSFECRCNDGTADSPTVTVNINVNPNVPSGATLNLARSSFNAADSFASLMSGSSTSSSTPTQNPVWTSTGSLNTARVLHTSTLLSNGEVLVAGGTSNAVRSLFTGRGFLKRAELFDPVTGTWRRTGDLNTARGNHTATILTGRKVLVVGGTADNGTPLRSAELYDPATGIWTRTRNPNVARALHTATLLPDGKVLIAGGTGNGLSFLNSGELYDPATDTWTSTRDLKAGRWAHSATLLPNGKVLVAGGYSLSGSLIQNSAELYNPATDTWTRTLGNLNAARSHHTATLLLDGKLLVACGLGFSGILNSAELFDPSTERWTRTHGNLNVGRWAPTATMLRDGKVLVAGGTGDGTFSLNDTNSAELYDPDTDTWTRTTNLVTGRHSHTASLLYNNKILVVGGMRAGTTLNTAELFDPLDPRPLTSTCSPITVTQLHGEGFFGNSRIARIENGRVGCVNVDTNEVSECLFSTTGASSSLMWLDAVDGQYAKTGQAITLEGEPGGDWIVAARVSADGTVPCVAPVGRDVGGRVADSEILSRTCTVETPLAPWNSRSAYGYYPLINFSGLVCTSSNPHPDQAELNRTTTSCSGSVFCYIGRGAALNDINGTERDSSGFYYLEPERCHMIVIEELGLPGAKRPATSSKPVPGSVDVTTPLVWRTVSPNVRIAN